MIHLEDLNELALIDCRDAIEHGLTNKHSLSLSRYGQLSFFKESNEKLYKYYAVDKKYLRQIMSGKQEEMKYPIDLADSSDPKLSKIGGKK